MKRTFFTRATVLSGTDAPERQTTVVVAANRIAAVGRGSEVPEPDAGDEVVDLAGATLMPGLFQCHMHAAMDDTESFIELDMKYPPNYLTLVAARNVNRM